MRLSYGFILISAPESPEKIAGISSMHLPCCSIFSLQDSPFSHMGISDRILRDGILQVGLANFYWPSSIPANENARKRRKFAAPPDPFPHTPKTHHVRSHLLCFRRQGRRAHLQRVQHHRQARRCQGPGEHVAGTSSSLPVSRSRSRIAFFYSRSSANEEAIDPL